MDFTKIQRVIKNYGQNIDITILVQLLVYLGTVYLFPKNNLITNMLTIDSTISAIRFIKTLYESEGSELIYNYKKNELYENDLMMRKLKDHISKNYPNHINKFIFTNDGKIRFMEKYFLFGVCQLITCIMQVLLWSFNSVLKTMINTILLLFSVPIFYTLITSFIYFIKLLRSFIENIKKIINYLMSKITAKIINKLTEATLNQNPKINYIEILNYYEDFGGNLIKTYQFTKTVISLTLIHYCKKTENIIYYYISNLLEKYQTDELIKYTPTQYTDEEKQKKLLLIIKERKWNELLKPKTINMLFELYTSENKNKEQDTFSTKIGIIIRNIRINFLRFMALWSIAIVYPPVALMIDSYYTYFNSKFFVRNHCLSYLLSALLLFNYPLIGSFLMVTCDYIIKPLLEYIEEHNILNKYFIRNDDQLKYLGLLSLLYYLHWIGLLICFPIQYYNRDKRLTITTIMVILLNSISNFNIYHLICLWAFTTIINNIFNLDKLENNFSINLVEDYLNNPLSKINLSKIEIIKITERFRKSKKLSVKEKENICKMMSNLFNFRN